MMTALGILTTVIGGLGIFMFGMKFLSDGAQALAGTRLSRLISAITDNRLFAVLAGMGVTMVIQSSSATTVMVVGFVNSGIMTLLQGIGVIFGANIGTTITAWIMTLNLSKYGLFIAGVAALFYLFVKRERLHFISMLVLGIGLLFFGLEIMSKGLHPLRGMPEVQAWLAHFDAGSNSGFLAAMLIGALVTGIIQSSSAFVGIVMSLTLTQVVTFETAVALILGSNIGTTVTALLACIGASRNAVRAAVAHTLFNLLGVAIVAPFHVPFTHFCDVLTRTLAPLAATPVAGDGYPYPMLGIAITHTVFNVGATLLFLPFMPCFAKLVTLLIPIRPSESKPERYQAVHLDNRLLTQPAIALDRAQREITRMGETCQDMLKDLQQILGPEKNNADLEQSIFLREEDMDVAQMEISRYVSALLHDYIRHDLGVQIRRVLRQADEFESVSDAICTALKAFLKIRSAGETLSEEATNEVLTLAAKVEDYTRTVMDILAREAAREIGSARAISHTISDLAKSYRAAHMGRLANTCSSPVKSLVYSDLLYGFRQMNEHLLNIAETLEV